MDDSQPINNKSEINFILYIKKVIKMKIKLHRIHSDEEWKLITHINGIEHDFVKKYYISNYGQIKTDDRYMSPSIRGKYLRITLRYKENGKKISKSYSIHRLVCEYFCKPNYNNLPTVDHIDGDTTNNYYKNLEWCSYKEQAKRAYNLGLTYIPCGEESHLTTISEDLARNICELLSKGLNVTEIRNELGLSTKYSEIIARIRKRKTWKWLSKNYDFSTKPFPKEYIPDNIMHDICKMIQNNFTYNEIYIKYKKYFDKFKNPKEKFRDIKNKRSYKRISDLYF